MRRTWTLLRHGERSPISPSFLTPGCGTVRDEARLWRSKLVLPDDGERLRALYPVAHEDGFAYVRKAGERETAFAALTAKGLETCAALGRSARVSGGVAVASARSTNYGRTIRSARAFLDGLGAPGCRIAVRRTCRDALNGYDANPERVKRAMRSAMASVRFADADAGVADAKRALIAAIPGASNETFGWLLAVDYLDARRAHGLETPKAYDAGLEADARSHLLWRYDAWARDPAVSRLVARPLLAELREWAADPSENRTSPTLDLRCAHDVTVLALARALGAPPLAPRFAAKLDVTMEGGGVSVSLDGAPLDAPTLESGPVAADAFVALLDAAVARDGCPP